MEFARTDEQRMLVDTVREFARTTITPTVAELDQRAEFPAQALAGAAELGLLGMVVPDAYGGADLDPLSVVFVYEEIARASASLAVILSVHNTLVCGGIREFGTEAQRERYLPQLANGALLGAYALTESSAGSDAASIQTTAQRQGNGYRLNGGKRFITSAEHAGLFILFVVTDLEARSSRRISAFLLEAGTPGFTIGRRELKLGLRSSEINDLILSDVDLPLDARLGEEGAGYPMALSLLASGRIGIAAQAVGITQAALDCSLTYAQERQQFGRPIAEFEAIQWKLADMATELEAARLLTYRAAARKRDGQPYARAAAQAKLFASRVAVRAADAAVQIHGGYGYIAEYPAERLYRDAKATELYEGTSEIQRLVIARDLLRGGD